METKELGNSGVMVPEIGIGVWRYRGVSSRCAALSNWGRT